MDVKRALWMGFLVYIISFIIGTIVGILMGVDFSTAASVPDSVWAVNIVLAIIIVGTFGVWYFKKVTPSWKQGALLGIMFVLVGFIIDLLLVIPWIMFSDSPADIVSYYTNPLFWLTLLLIVLTTAVVGWFKGRK